MQRGGADMYCAVMPTGPSGRQDGEGGYGFAYGGRGPPSGEPSQLHSGGGYGGLPNGLPGGGGGSGLGDSGGGGANPNPLPHAGPQVPFVNGRLKGTAPAIFDGNCKNTKQFMQEFTLYRMINQDSIMVRIAYTRTALALSFMQGLAINDWILQQTDSLYVKCNGDAVNGIALTYQVDDERLWIEFSHDFRCAFTDTALEQQAYGELASCTMGNKTIDEYIAQFEHLLQKVGWDRMSRGSLFQFKKGLDQKIHLKILQKELMPVEALDNWKEAARKEVE